MCVRARARLLLDPLPAHDLDDALGAGPAEGVAAAAGGRDHGGGGLVGPEPERVQLLAGFEAARAHGPGGYFIYFTLYFIDYI